MAKFKPAAEELRRLLLAADEPLKDIAERAGVPYTPLWKWVTGRQKSYNLIQAELVYHSLTGKTFLRP